VAAHAAASVGSLVVQLAAVSFSWTKMVMMVMAMMAAAEVRAACVGAKWGRNPSSVGW